MTSGHRRVVNPVECGVGEIPAGTVAHDVVLVDQIDAHDLNDGSLASRRELPGMREGEPLPTTASQVSLDDVPVRRLRELEAGHVRSPRRTG